MVHHAEELQSILPLIEAAPRVALDTEADSLHCYREKLCLIQVAVPGMEDGRLIDPLAGYDLAPFYAVIAQKPLVLHGADYDLRLFKRSANFVPADLFDTMIAARLVGRREFSLAALVKAEFGFEMTKGSQKANWARRPLTEQMMVYARNDTRYLFEIADRLTGALHEKGRWEWFVQSCQRLLSNVSETEGEKNRDENWRIQGAGSFRGRSAAVLRALWWWRDAEAARADRPPFHILRNEDLLAITKSIESSGRIPTFRHVQGPRLRRLQTAVEEAQALPESEWPARPRHRFPRPTAAMDAKVSELKTKRDAVATQLDLDPSLIASRGIIEGIAYRNEKPEDLLMPWQRELLHL